MAGEVCTGQLALVNWGGPLGGRTSGASKESEGWSLVVCQGDQLNALRLYSNLSLGSHSHSQHNYKHKHRH